MFMFLISNCEHLAFISAQSLSSIVDMKMSILLPLIDIWDVVY